MSIEYVLDQVQELPFGKQSAIATSNFEQSNVMPQIEFKWKRRDHPEVVSRPKFTGVGMQVGDDTQNAAYFPSIWYNPGSLETPDENAKRFSHLDKAGDGNADLVRAVVLQEFPFIKNISIQYHASIPMMFAELQNKPRKIPVALLSDGINRLLGISISLAYFAGGTMLIDQLEDGFHYTILQSIWNSIYQLATKFKVQLFVSTHSRECIDALMPTIKGHEQEFCLLQASRGEHGCSVKSLDGRYLETALEQQFEVR